MRDTGISRRYFLMGATMAAGSFAAGSAAATPRRKRRKVSPNEKLNIAGIGIGGMGGVDLDNLKSENIVALCDVDDAYAAKVYERYPNAKRYRDFRVMLEKQKDIDAVTIATPDHLHAVISMAAIQLGKHVYCQKPLTHSVYEARMVAKAAREAKVATQMGNQGQASEEARVLYELIHGGAIGTVREIHGWCNRNPSISPRGMPRPEGSSPVPDTLDWDLWLGPAPFRPYVEHAYNPFVWRGWWDFGTGVLGDIGCHNFSAIFKTLKLGPPSCVEATSTAAQCPPEVNNESAPTASIVRFEFPALGDRPAVTLTWWDGGLMPWRPKELEPERQMGGGDGMLYIGDKGKILNHRLIPETRMKEYGAPPKILPRSPGHYQEWINACKGGDPAGSNFDFAGPLTEAVLLGNIAIRTGKKICWDSETMTITNVPEANALINPPYREGWSLGV
ncbi:MAG TPA: Gfo/Idh/MocA family oxidoreductase [Candidatus Hydrogenedentes bacterium]|nr:Gfo/Idh/MocA family oxidoreductase [Candidatus Hydrogenedentota bacterium]HRT20641.1 Gfo/Idh/MocA family oxidoreductase [Candidatus Hydrogenedentota bacterium]HRT65676.1 Gfo/Idh/MocA family oxidoreductase [Candidatus Hydrogenedentota bacterium]